MTKIELINSLKHPTLTIEDICERITEEEIRATKPRDLVILSAAFELMKVKPVKQPVTKRKEETDTAE